MRVSTQKVFELLDRDGNGFIDGVDKLQDGRSITSALSQSCKSAPAKMNAQQFDRFIKSTGMKTEAILGMDTFAEQAMRKVEPPAIQEAASRVGYFLLGILSTIFAPLAAVLMLPLLIAPFWYAQAFEDYYTYGMREAFKKWPNHHGVDGVGAAPASIVETLNAHCQKP